MNVLLLLTPKSEVDYVNEDATLFKALQKIQERNYSAIPIVGKDGRYVGTITTGDILGYIKENKDLSLRESADIPLKDIRRIRDNKPVNGNCRVEDIFDIITYQNFIPVVDDEQKFIGIITRREIIKIMHDKYIKENTNKSEE